MPEPVSMNILVIDDDTQVRASVGKFLIARGHTVVEAANGEMGLDIIQKQTIDIVITDVKMPGIDGFEVLRQIKSKSPETEVIVVTGIKEAENAFRALREGAFDFFNKPFKIEDLNAAIQRTVRYQTLRKEKNRVQAQLERIEAKDRNQNGLEAIVGNSPPMLKMKAQIEQVASTNNTTVLIVGETGTGKELVAKAVHYESDRTASPFIPINCSAIPNALFESEFFGHTKGAFTDAKTDRKGYFELAQGGTLFLDEIGDMTPEMQVRLLRTLEDRHIRPVGGQREMPIDVRVVAATNRDLPQAVQKGTFREDLFYRLNVFTIQIPPLRKRANDVLHLAQHFLKGYAHDLRKPITDFSEEAKELLQSQVFPGNVRMLKNTIERAIILCTQNEISIEDLMFDLVENTPTPNEELSSANLTKDIEHVIQDLAEDQMNLPIFERSLIQEALRRTNGNQSRAANILGISRMILRSRIKKYNL